MMFYLNLNNFYQRGNMKDKYTHCPAFKRRHSSKTKTVIVGKNKCCEVCGKYVFKANQ